MVFKLVLNKTTTLVTTMFNYLASPKYISVSIIVNVNLTTH